MCLSFIKEDVNLGKITTVSSFNCGSCRCYFLVFEHVDCDLKLSNGTNSKMLTAAQSVERLTAEREVAGSISGTKK